MIGQHKNIALVAHDRKKTDLLDWVQYNQETLRQHSLFATGTTGTLIEQTLKTPITKFNSGPLGGDQQIGSRISEGIIDLLIFFWDPMESLSHDTDIKALLRISVVWNIPVANNRITADYLISSPLFSRAYINQTPDYSTYLQRKTQVM